MRSSLVSILTPSFQQARWLADNLRSVERQSYPAIEHVVFDGGSTDGSVAILKAHARPALRWESGPDAGQSDALNKALRAATGEIVGWLNSDDAYFSTDVVAAAVHVFEANPGVDVVYGHAALVNGDGLVIQLLWAPPFSRSLLLLHDFISQPAAFVRRTALRDRMVDPTFHYAMDYELWLRLSRSGSQRFKRMDRIVAIDRHHADRKSYTWLDAADRDHAVLRATYGGPRIDAPARLGRKLTKVLLRLAGIAMVPRAIRGATELGWRVDGACPLARRQVATFRSSMPIGSPSRDAPSP
jgi:glycosyltransferase involved in cell wall biosynthesis